MEDVTEASSTTVVPGDEGVGDICPGASLAAVAVDSDGSVSTISGAVLGGLNSDVDDNGSV
jgi:hypothetical protein